MKLECSAIKHWSAGGETSLGNLVQLCRLDHRLVHEGGFNCRRAADGEIVFEAPIGQVLNSPQPLPHVPSAMRLEHFLEIHALDLEIDSDTCVSKWQGERMDWDMAMEAVCAQGAYAPDRQWPVQGPIVVDCTDAG